MCPEADISMYFFSIKKSIASLTSFRYKHALPAVAQLELTGEWTKKCP